MEEKTQLLELTHIYPEDTCTLVEALEKCLRSSGTSSAVLLNPENAHEIRMMAWNPLDEAWVQYLNNPLYAPAWSPSRGILPDSVLKDWVVIPTADAKKLVLSQHQAFMVQSEE